MIKNFYRHVDHLLSRHVDHAIFRHWKSTTHLIYALSPYLALLYLYLYLHLNFDLSLLFSETLSLSYSLGAIHLPTARDFSYNSITGVMFIFIQNSNK